MSKPEYSAREGWKSPGFGYASDMVARAVNNDDAEGFLKYIEECGGFDCEVLISGSVANYAATHGASNCVRAMFADGRKEVSGHDLEYWLKVAAAPVYGPNALKLV